MVGVYAASTPDAPKWPFHGVARADSVHTLRSLRNRTCRAASDQPSARAQRAPDRYVPRPRAFEGRILRLVKDADFPWQEAIAQHGRRVVVSLLARGAPLHEAEELAQEAWTRLIAQRASGELQRIELPGLAIRQALFLLSDARRRSAKQVDPEEARRELEAPDLERELLSRSQLQRALFALNGLSPRAREVFEFVYTHPELGHAQAAETLGMSTQRVRQTLFEVRQKLRAALEEKS